MGVADVRRFRRDMPAGSTVLLDTNVLIYHLEGLSPYAELTRALLEMLATAELEATISTLSVAELLAGPYRSGNEAKVAIAKNFVENLPNTSHADVDLQVADRAAWLRAHGLQMPDAIILATAIVAGVDVVLTNDPGLQLDSPGVPRVSLLDEYCRE